MSVIRGQRFNHTTTGSAGARCLLPQTLFRSTAASFPRPRSPRPLNHPPSAKVTWFPRCLLLQTKFLGLQTPPPSDPQILGLRPLLQGVHKWRFPASTSRKMGLGIPVPELGGGDLLHLWETSVLPQFPPPNPAPVGPAPVPPYPGAGRPGPSNLPEEARSSYLGRPSLLPGCPWRRCGSSSGSLAARTPAARRLLTVCAWEGLGLGGGGAAPDGGGGAADPA